MHTNYNYTDWQSPRKSTAALVNEFAASIAPGRIALHHDGGNARPTANAVGSFITAGHQRGYRFVRATELVNSGMPMPASGAYLQQELGVDPANTSAESIYQDHCNFDLAATLTDILRNGVLDYDTKMNINAELAELQQLAKQE